MSKNITCKIIRNVGTIPRDGNGWDKKLKVVSWNDDEPKYDLRAWDPEDERNGKGITLTENEIRALFEILRQELVHLEKE